MKILVNSFIAFYLNSCLFVVLFFFLHVQLQRVLLFQLMTESRTHNGKDVSYFFPPCDILIFWGCQVRPTVSPSERRYVDDTFTAVHKDEIDDFHEHLNGQNADIQFTKEIEENGKIRFLDCLVTRDNNELRTTIYRKPTHTDRLLQQSSYNPTSYKATTIRTLTRRAQLVCDSPDSLTDENKYLDNVFNKNNYNRDFIRHNTYRNSEPNATNTNATPVTTETIPYIKGTS